MSRAHFFGFLLTHAAGEATDRPTLARAASRPRREA